jgi:hypothetical protein
MRTDEVRLCWEKQETRQHIFQRIRALAKFLPWYEELPAGMFAEKDTHAHARTHTHTHILPSFFFCHFKEVMTRTLQSVVS